MLRATLLLRFAISAISRSILVREQVLGPAGTILLSKVPFSTIGTIPPLLMGGN